MVDKAPFEIILREKWSHIQCGTFPQDSTRPMERLRAPATGVVWTNTKTKVCKTLDKCLRMISEIQLYHLKGGHFDIPFHFVIGPDGMIYQGRDWYWAAQVPYTNEHIIELRLPPHHNRGVVIAHMGKKIETDPEHPMAQATKRIIDYGVELNIIRPDYETIVQPFWITY